MDYEKLYNQVLGRAKIAYKDTDRHLKATLERIFKESSPELREVEDERIRKELIQYFEKVELHYMNRDEILAWLEKQGEQKSIIIIPQFKVGDTIKPKPYNEEHLIKDINENGYVLDVGIIIPFKDEDVWEIVEQKSSWSEEDKEIMEALNDYVKNLDVFFSEIKIGDKDILSKEFRGKVQHWLKSLKDRVQPQPKREWSEEDEQYLQKAIECAFGNGYLSVSDWLKSLKFRIDGSQWRPSEKQIDALKKSFEIMDNGFDKENLRSLYCALKHFF